MFKGWISAQNAHTNKPIYLNIDNIISVGRRENGDTEIACVGDIIYISSDLPKIILDRILDHGN